MKNFTASLIAPAIALLIAIPALAADPAPAAPAPVPAASVSAPAPATPPPAVTPPPMPPFLADKLAKGDLVKIGYIDLPKLAAESDKGKEIKKELTTRAENLRTKIENREKQLEKQREEIKAKLEKLSPKERAAKTKEFQKKVEDLQKLIKSSNEEMQVQEQKLSEELYKDLRKVATEYGATNGYHILVKKGDLLYLNSHTDSKDVTAEIMEKLNGQKHAN